MQFVSCVATFVLLNPKIPIWGQLTYLIKLRKIEQNDCSQFCCFLDENLSRTTKIEQNVYFAFVPVCSYAVRKSPWRNFK